MLDSFRKRDNVRPTPGTQPGVRPGAPNLVHAPGALAPAVPARPEPAVVNAAPLDPNPPTSTAAQVRESAITEAMRPTK